MCVCKQLCVFMCVSFLRIHSSSLHNCANASVGMSAFMCVTFFFGINVNISDGVNVCKVRKGDNRKQTG